MNKIPNRVDPGHLPRIDARIDCAVQCGLLAPGPGRRLRLAARLLTGEVVSGEALAVGLGMSRAAVHKQVEALRDAGWPVVSRPGAGYRTDGLPTDVGCEAVVPWVLARDDVALPGRPGFVCLPYLHQPQAASSNDLLKVEAERGVPEGAVAVVDEQVAGRGRLGRHWVGRKGESLTFSVLLRPRVEPSRLSLLPLAAALGVARALADDCGLGKRVSIKWPNDVLVDARKVCGILGEASVDMDSVHWLVAGIGVNVNGHPAGLVPPGEVALGREPAVSLEEALGGRCVLAPVLAAVLAGVGWAFQLAQTDTRAFLDGYTSFDCLRGGTVRVACGMGGDDVVQGTAMGLSDDGSLLVRDAAAHTVGISAGDVYRVRPAS